MKKVLLLASVMSAMAFSAQAIEIKPYVGLDYNYSSIDVAKNSKNWGVEDDYNSASIVAGAKMHKNFGLEAFYQRSLNESRSFQDTTKVTSRISGYGLDALGYLPLGCEQKVELIGGLGIGEYELKARTYADSKKDYGIGYRMSAGAQYNINDKIAIRGMFRHVIVEHSDLDIINEYSAGIRYSF